MSDPFQFLKDKRQDAEELARKQAERRKQLQTPSSLQALEPAVRRYNAIVVRLLSRLREAFYTDCEREIRQDRFPKALEGQEHWIWSIVSWSSANRIYTERVSVHLVRDLSRNKFYFTCCRKDSPREIITDLSEPALEQALQDLFR